MHPFDLTSFPFLIPVSPFCLLLISIPFHLLCIAFPIHLLFNSTPDPAGGELILSDSVVRGMIGQDQVTAAPSVPVDILHGYHLETGYFTRLDPAREGVVCCYCLCAVDRFYFRFSYTTLFSSFEAKREAARLTTFIV